MEAESRDAPPAELCDSKCKGPLRENPGGRQGSGAPGEDELSVLKVEGALMLEGAGGPQSDLFAGSFYGQGRWH